MLVLDQSNCRYFRKSTDAQLLVKHEIITRHINTVSETYRMKCYSLLIFAPKKFESISKLSQQKFDSRYNSLTIKSVQLVLKVT